MCVLWSDGQVSVSALLVCCVRGRVCVCVYESVCVFCGQMDRSRSQRCSCVVFVGECVCVRVCESV